MIAFTTIVLCLLCYLIHKGSPIKIEIKHTHEVITPQVTPPTPEQLKDDEQLKAAQEQITKAIQEAMGVSEDEL